MTRVIEKENEIEVASEAIMEVVKIVDLAVDGARMIARGRNCRHMTKSRILKGKRVSTFQ